MRWILSFLWAIAVDWTARMSGIASLVFLAIVVSGAWNAVPRWAFFMASAIFFFVAAARVWKNEHDKLLAEQEKNYPLLRGELDRFACGDTKTPSRDAHAFILLIIKNIGAQTPVSDFELRVEAAGKVYHAQHMLISENEVISTDSGPFAEFHGSEALYEKTVEPIQKNDWEKGWLRFAFKTTSEKLCSPGALWIASFKDITGKVYTATKVASGIPQQQVTYIPGAEQPFLSIPPPSPSQPEK